MKRKDWINSLKVGDKVTIKWVGEDCAIFSKIGIDNIFQLCVTHNNKTIGQIYEITEDYINVEKFKFNKDGIFTKNKKIGKIYKTNKKDEKDINELLILSEVKAIAKIISENINKLDVEQKNHIITSFKNMKNSLYKREGIDAKIVGFCCYEDSLRRGD